jgi:hypothetical protein
MIFKIFLIAISLGVLFGIILPFIVFPNYLFRRKLRRTMELENLAQKLKERSPLKTLKNSFNFVITNHYGLDESFKNKFFHLANLFHNNPNNYLGKKHYLFCHTQNLFLKTILILTGQFSEEEIKVKWSIGKSFIIHQYLLIKVGNRIIKADPFYRILQIL